jgi:chemotaxis signal transduction protein
MPRIFCACLGRQHSMKKVEELRQAFDSSFAFPPPSTEDDLVDLLAVTADAGALAVPLTDMAGLTTDRTITPLPGSPPTMLGVAGLRGHLIPVYDLARVLGKGQAKESRWIVLAAGSPAFAVAVDRVDGHLRVPREAIAEPTGETTHAVVHTRDGPRPVVDLATVREMITEQET